MGSKGESIDAFARQYLWQDGKNYAHGTGHGVGSCLSVHEGPQRISPYNSDAALMPNMILSNEPGYYEVGKYGIRIENLVYVVKSKDPGFLRFENLTMLPYHNDLINFAMLCDNEHKYIENYHAKIMQIIYPKLSVRAQKWLENEVTPKNKY